MAERVLPSREDAMEWSDRYAEVANPRSMVNIVAAYASGELKTEAERREAIDYEAAQRVLDIIDQLVPPLRTADDARPIVDAALPDQDV